MPCARPLVSSFRPLASSGCALVRCAPSRGLRTKPATSQQPPPTPGAGRLRTIESMPFQTYQLALEVIRKDREEKLKELRVEQEKLAKELKKPGVTPKSRQVLSLRRHVEWLKIQADMNNPRVKYNFDRGLIDMHKPIYRYLMDRKWREYRRPLLMQRVTQMNVVPDVLPYIDPVVDVQVRFRGKDIAPGDYIMSNVTEARPTLKIIPFHEGDMLCTVAVVDPDVPDVRKNSFSYGLHWLVSNIPISPGQTQALGTGAKPSDTIVPWLPPHVQKGALYHRYSMFVFQQPHKIDAEALEGKIKREDFVLRSFQAKHQLEPIGVFMWRGEWDQHTKAVMQKHDLKGWDKMWIRPTKSMVESAQGGELAPWSL